MGHLDYYQYQTTARGIRGLADVERISHEKAYVYDRIVRPWLPTGAGSPIAELACGHGSFLFWLKEQGFTQVTGVDSSAAQIEFARQIIPGVTRADLNDWLARQPDVSQQTIVGIDLIEHISKDDLMVLLQGARRVLRPGGRLILRYPNGDSPLVGMNLFNDITHVWTYTPNCLDTLARMHGFSHAEFLDESCAAIRDQRWLKVPLCRLSQWLLGFLLRAAAKERVRYWSPHLWACLEK
jgi:SAM-dependent methyltransferase